VTPDQARATVEERLGVAVAGADNALSATVPVERWLELGELAKTTLGCLYMSFSTAVDWKEQGLEVIARVENLDANFSVTMRTKLPSDRPHCPSFASLWRGADWMERECYDMFGIRFDGHPDLRRILLPQDWEGHPLLKSYAVDTAHPPYR
jgi:NADH-quinone oxidoreductase subunit C